MTPTRAPGPDPVPGHSPAAAEGERTDAVGGVSEYVTTLIRAADTEARNRHDRAVEHAAVIVADARAEATHVIDMAYRMSDDLVDAAREEARKIVADARSDARSLLTAAAERARAMIEGAREVHDDADALSVSLLETVPAPENGGAPAVADDRAAGHRRRRAPEPPAPKRAPAPGGWGAFTYRARWFLLVAGVVVAVLSALWGPGVIASMSAGGFEVEGSQSVAASDEIVAAVGRQDSDVVALYTATEGRADTPAFQEAVESAVARVPAADVTGTFSLWSTGSPAFLSEDGRSTYVILRLQGDIDERSETFRRIAPLLEIDPEVGRTDLGGDSAIEVGIDDQVGEDLTRAETLSAPFLAVLLVIIFGSVVAAGLPLLVGGITVVGSFVMLRVIAEFTEVSVFAVNIVTLLGLGLSIDYALLVVSRFREELRAGRQVRDAVAVTMATAGRSIVFSAVIVAATLATLLWFPVVFLRSMAYGGVAAVAVAALASVTVLPALLSVLGHRVDALTLPFRRYRPSQSRPAEQHGRWARLARHVMRRPVVYAVMLSILLIALASPSLGVRFGGIDERQLPPDAPSRLVAERLASDFPDTQVSPIQVLVLGADEAALSSISAEIGELADVEGVATVAATEDATLLAVDYPGKAVDPQARGIVGEIRDLDPRPGVSVLVGGDTAESVDLRESIVSGLPVMLASVAVVTFVLLFLAFGSFVLPIKAMIMNVLAVSAAFGVVVLVFQYGYGADLLGVTTTGFVEFTQPILVLAILFGLSTDYEVFLLSRVREEWDARRDNREAVAVGLQRTGPIITSAAALVLVVIAAFSTSEITFIKLIGVGMGVAILLDATVVRALLVPATMRLLGTWNWWAPRPLRLMWERNRPHPPAAAAAGDTTSDTTSDSNRDKSRDKGRDRRRDGVRAAQA